MTREQQGEIIRQAAARIGTRPEWLDALINFETAGTYDTAISNPNSSARGLIQFTNSSAQDLGYADSTALVETHRDFESQMMNAVIPYFAVKARQNRIGSYQNKQALYMAVFYPAYWNKPVDTPFPAEVRSVNPGIVTPADYIRYVDGRIRPGELRINPTIPLLLIAAAGVTLWFLYRSSRG